MLKQALLVVTIVFGLIETSPAIAFDSTDTIYIDGQPCGGFCQAYMTWAQAAARQSAGRPAPLARQEIKPSMRHSRKVRREGPAPSVHAANRNSGTVKHSLRQQIPLTAHHQMSAPSQADAGQVARDDPQTKSGAAAQSNIANSQMPVSNPTADSPNPDVPSIKESLVAATGVAEKLTDATSASTEKTTDAVTTASIQTDADRLVAILFARPEIKSVSDLSRRNIAIDEMRSGLSEKIRTAIVAAGAAEVQLSDSSQSVAIDAVMDGEMPAAVLALLTTEAANAFPEIAGFKIFRVPLSPR